MPTVTPGRIQEGVDDLVARAGLSTARFLGLSASDWINLLISLAYVLFGYLAGTLVIRRALPSLARRTQTELDDMLLEAAGPGVRWLVVLLALHFATKRLSFLSVEAKVLLGDAYFVLALVLAFRIVWNLLGLAGQWYRDWAIGAEREEELGPVITLLVSLGRILAAIVAITVLLSRFGVNISGLLTALGLGGLAISLAARDTIADAIAGFIILVDQPFRMGDRIEIQGVGTWGDVVNIGLRTTRIRTRDNRMVIVPNSLIGSNQVINYSYPDPRYRIETHVGLGYGTDIEGARRIIKETVQQVEGVLTDQPVDALYVEMGDSAMIFRVRWWIESYIDTRQVFDRVHTALQDRLDAAGIDMPYPTQSLNLQVEPETAERFSQALRGPGEGEAGAHGLPNAGGERKQ
jgi:small-conductance mechanosensitive channel